MSGTAAPGRTFSWLVHPDQWARCAHDGTALLPDGTVELTWSEDTGPTGPAPGPSAEEGSLAFDAGCRAYRSRPARGRVDVLPPGLGRPARRRPAPGRAACCPTPPAWPSTGSSGSTSSRPTPSGWSTCATDRLLRRVAVPGGRPVDVAPDCGRALVLVRGRRGGRLLVLDGRRGARPGPELVRPCYPGRATPRRLTSARDAGVRARPAGALARARRARRGGPAGRHRARSSWTARRTSTSAPADGWSSAPGRAVRSGTSSSTGTSSSSGSRCGPPASTVARWPSPPTAGWRSRPRPGTPGPPARPRAGAPRGGW